MSDGHLGVELRGALETFGCFPCFVVVEVDETKIVVRSGAFRPELDCGLQRSDRFLVLAVLPEKLGQLNMSVDVTRMLPDHPIDQLDPPPRDAKLTGNRRQHLYGCHVVRVMLENVPALEFGLVQVAVAISGHCLLEQLIDRFRFCEHHAFSSCSCPSALSDAVGSPSAANSGPRCFSYFRQRPIELL